MCKTPSDVKHDKTDVRLAQIDALLQGPSSSWPTDRPTLAERVLRSLERMNRTCCRAAELGRSLKLLL